MVRSTGVRSDSKALVRTKGVNLLKDAIGKAEA